MNVDFLAGPINDFGATMTRKAVTLTTAGNGDKVESWGADETITAVLENTQQKYDLTQAGLQHGADARLFVKASQTIAKYDKIIYRGLSYKIETVSPQYSLGHELAFYTCLLYLFDD